ncbi:MULTISPECIES: glycosyltransferase [Spiribacter]|nr:MULTISPECIES: glycosyltransferase [Spiribacter]
MRAAEIFMSNAILFHHPGPINDGLQSGRPVRVKNLLQAFSEIGFEVDVIAGNVSQRRKAAKKVKDKIGHGRQYKFMYAESSTMPTALTTASHFPIAPCMDPEIFFYLKRKNIPIGLFYRDIYWRFEEYSQKVSFWKRVFAISFFRYDLQWYQKTLKVMYLPSLQMGRFLPNPAKFNLSALPPAVGENSIGAPAETVTEPLNILYVGGLSSHYRLHVLFRVISRLSGVKLTVCTRSQEWSQLEHEYEEWLTPNIEIVHLSGEQLPELYEQHDVCSLFLEPNLYRSFAAPVKLYEYIGACRPIIASQDTNAGDFVEENNVGWSISYDDHSLEELLKYLISSPSEIIKQGRNCKPVAKKNTWRNRAENVARYLGDLDQ